MTTKRLKLRTRQFKNQVNALPTELLKWLTHLLVLVGGWHIHMHYQILFLPKMIINLSTVLISTFVPPSMNYIDDTESNKAIKYVHKDIKTNMDNHFFFSYG